MFAGRGTRADGAGGGGFAQDLRAHVAAVGLSLLQLAAVISEQRNVQSSSCAMKQENMHQGWKREMWALLHVEEQTTSTRALTFG